jgi:hypothetical protein
MFGMCWKKTAINCSDKELISKVKAKWELINKQDFINNLYGSIPKRITNIIENKGEITNY